MKEFVKKYSLIVFLVAMIIILGFVKVFFNNKPNTDELNSNPNNNVSTDITTDSNNIGGSDTEIGIVEDNPQNETTKTDENFEKLFDKYVSFETVEERETWADSLSSEEQRILVGEEAITLSQLNDELPYEGNTFIVEDVFSNNVLMAKSKIDDLEKAENDLRDWLSSKAMNFSNLSIVWE